MSLAREITKRLAGDWNGRHGLVPGPGHSKRDRSLSVRDNPSEPDDVIVHSFAGDNWQDIKAEWRRSGLLPQRFQGDRPFGEHEAVARLEAKERKQVEEQDNVARRLELARALWDRNEPIEASAAETYLRWRGITLDPLPITLRYLPATPPKHPFPAMIAAFAICRELEPGVLSFSHADITGVHLTALAPDGRGKARIDAPRKMIGKSVGTPITLAAPNDNLALAIGEGIETMLWVAQSTGMGALAATAANRLPALADAVPHYIEAVTVFADADLAGRKFATELAERLTARGIETLIAEAIHGA